MPHTLSATRNLARASRHDHPDFGRTALAKVGRAISGGRLKVRRVGKRMIVLHEDGIKFLQTLPEGPAAMPANLKRPRRSAEAEARSEEGV